MLWTLGNHNMGYLTVIKGLGTEKHDKGYLLMANMDIPQNILPSVLSTG